MIQIYSAKSVNLSPSKIEFFIILRVSKCTLNEHRTEPVVVVAIAVRIIERKATRIRAVPIIASAFEEWIATNREVRVVQFNPYN